MILSQFLRVLPPPVTPYAVEGTWHDVESHLGVVLPEDYKHLVSAYGRGVFLPSKIRLCNYLDLSSSDLDYFIDCSQDGLDAGDWLPYQFYPDPEGLLPFARFASDVYFFWNRKNQPWSIVCINRLDRSMEEVHMPTMDFIFRCLQLDADRPLRSLAGFLSNVQDETPTQYFRAEPRKLLIDPSICRVVARGGRHITYRVANCLTISTPEDIYLRSANVEKVPEIVWVQTPSSTLPNVAPDVFFTLLVKECSSIQALDERRDALYHTYFSARSTREQGQTQTPLGAIYWVLASDSRESRDIIAYDYILIGKIESLMWELHASIGRRHLAQLRPVADAMAQSIRSC